MHATYDRSRREFLRTTTTAAAALAALPLGSRTLVAEDRKAKILKTLKIGMVGVGKTLDEKFQAAKQAGFDGIELSAPGLDIDATKAAIAKNDFPVDGTVCARHWQIRHTSAKRDERETALKLLKNALRETKEVGGDTVLLVIGHGKDGPEDVIWKRALVNIAKAVPTAERLEMHIAIENVWNHFLYDHEGGADQTAEKYAQFVDQLDSPYVGMQFDIGNHWKYGSMGDWIRALNKRIVKLDLKGFSRKQDKFTKIGEGDLDWADVRKALAEIQYEGWAAAEVRGGDLERLKEVSANMDRVFGLK